MANVENIRKVIAMIEKEENYFNMEEWDTEKDNLQYPPNVCGTPSCIGGWAEAILRFEKKISDGYLAGYCVGEWLGLNMGDSGELFFPYHPVIMSEITRDQAVAHLNHIIETGEVNWSKFV